MTHVEASVDLAADPQRVLSFVGDTARFGQWLPAMGGLAVEHGAATRDAALAEGATMRYRWRLGPFTLRARERVTEWSPPERIAFEGQLAGAPFRSRMEATDRPAGGTALRVAIDYQLPALRGGALGERWSRPLVAAAVRRALARLELRLGVPEDLAPDETDLVALYRRRAGSYDRATQLYRLAGFRLRSFRRRAVRALGLGRGDTVVELGCGTGANFPWLVEAVGPSGRVIGVDLTDAMLQQAGRRVRRGGWRNVELVQRSAADYSFEPGTAGVLSTFALTHCPAYDAIIAAAAAALRPEGRFVLLDLAMPEGWPDWLMRAALATMRPYGVTLSAAGRRPVESLAHHFTEVTVEQLYWGVAYLATAHVAPAT